MIVDLMLVIIALLAVIAFLIAMYGWLIAWASAQDEARRRRADRLGGLGVAILLMSGAAAFVGWNYLQWHSSASSEPTFHNVAAEMPR